MSLIIAARFQTFEQAGVAANRLYQQGFPEADMHTFFVTHPGAHAQYPIGGDEYADPDARSAQWGAAAGAIIFGLLLSTLAGFFAPGILGSAWAVVVAAGVGAYIGALIGALWMSGRRRRLVAAPGMPVEERSPDVRRSGVVLALRVDPDKQEEVAGILRAAGGKDVERAQGRWSQGRWEDFDPVAPPDRV